MSTSTVTVRRATIERVGFVHGTWIPGGAHDLRTPMRMADAAGETFEIEMPLGALPGRGYRAGRIVELTLTDTGTVAAARYVRKL